MEMKSFYTRVADALLTEHGDNENALDAIMESARQAMAGMAMPQFAWEDECANDYKRKYQVVLKECNMLLMQQAALFYVYTIRSMDHIKNLTKLFSLFDDCC